MVDLVSVEISLWVVDMVEDLRAGSPLVVYFRFVLWAKHVFFGSRQCAAVLFQKCPKSAPT